MDIDNFEFRPLTDGLGFDKTTEESRRPSSRPADVTDSVEFEIPKKDFQEDSPAPVSRSLKKMLDSLPPSVDFTEDKHRELNLRSTPSKESQTSQVETTHVYKAPLNKEEFDVTLDNSLSQAFPKEEVSKRFYHQLVTPVAQYKEMSSSFASAAIDSLIVLGLASLFVVSLVAITGVDIVAMLTNRELSFRTMTELGMLYVGVTLFYFMLSRGMFGSTLGDWAFDVQLGSEDDRSHIMYPFQVIFRTFVILLTGVIMIPVLSVAFGKDLAFYFSGLKLYSRQY